MAVLLYFDLMETYKQAQQPRAIHWIGSSLKDIGKLPLGVQRTFGTVLALFERGINPPKELDIKKLKGKFEQTFEIRNSSNGEAYRLVYTTRLAGQVLVLHVFHKKSHSGSEVPREHIERITARQQVVEQFVKDQIPK